MKSLKINSERGASYVGVLIGVTIASLVLTAFTMGFVHGKRLTDAAKVKTAVTNASQDEMERVRGIGFDNLQSYTVDNGNVTGNVTVTNLTARRKQVVVSLSDTRFPSQRIDLLTYVHQNGLNP